MHRTTPQFWERLGRLPDGVQALARKNFELLRADPGHPSLHFKKVGKFWSARVGRTFRVLGVEDNGDIIWVWIGKHDDYERLIG